MSEFSGLVLPIVAEVTPAGSQSEGKVIATGKLGEIAKESVLNISAIIKKYIGRDITEGKRSLLVIHSLDKAKPKDRQRLMKILNMHTTDQKIRKEAISIIRKYGSIEYAKKYAHNLVKESWNEIDGSLPPSNAKEKLKAFASYLVEREI